MSKIIDKTQDPDITFVDVLSHDHVIIWPWETAPPSLKEYSTHGGDEDGILFIPNKLVRIYHDPDGELDCDIPYFIERIWMAYDDNQDFIRIKSGLLVIWAHA